MFTSLLLSPFILLLPFLLHLSASVSSSILHCNHTCGNLHIPFPFHLNTNSSCPTVSASTSVFNLSCSNSTSLFLKLDSLSYKVLEFYPDGVLVDFPGSSSCRQYNDLKAFGFSGNAYFGLSDYNVIGLYDCEDSSLCKPDCETVDFPGCDKNDSTTSSPTCCYPLSDHSSWSLGDGFSVFSKFGCRGFSCWLVSRGSSIGKRGVKLEWAVPRNLSKGICHGNAEIVNATTVVDGVRCRCLNGFVGDGFIDGLGCQKSHVKDGMEAQGSYRYEKKQSDRTVLILAGVLGPIFIVASLFALLYLLKRPPRDAGMYDPDQSNFHSSISFRKACRTKLFSYRKLEDATKGFGDAQKIVECTNGVIYAGVLGDGSYVAVHKIHCQDETDLINVLSGVEVLSAVLHRNLARILGCCFDCGYTPLVVYEYPGNGTLEEHLLEFEGGNDGLDWHKRLNIAAETANVLAFLQHEISPNMFHQELKSGCIFLDENLSVKIAGFRLLQANATYEGPQFHRSDVYDFGVLLLELISGPKQKDTSTTSLQKIRNGKLQELVDPGLYYYEQPAYCREQIEKVADLASRCLLFGGDGKIGIGDVARELIHINKGGIDGSSRRGPALEETFSNSSLLQMISMSPDSIHVPKIMQFSSE